MGQVNALLTIAAGSGYNVLNLDDSGDSSNRTGTLSASSVSGFGMAGSISFSGISAENLWLGSGTDNLTLASTIAGPTLIVGSGLDTINVHATTGATTLLGGAGGLTVNVGSTQPTQGGVVDSITGQLIVAGAGSSVNTLNVDDSGSTSNKLGYLTSSTVAGLNMALGITYSGMSAVNINLGQGSDHFIITSTHAGTTNVQTGNGSNIIDVQSTSGPLTVSGGSGAETLNVFSTGSTSTFNAGTGTATINIFSDGGPTTINSDSAVTTINIQSISGATTVNGDGRDVINVGGAAPALGGTVSSISALLNIVGDRGYDVVNVDATGVPLSETGYLSSTQSLRLGNAQGHYL